MITSKKKANQTERNNTKVSILFYSHGYCVSIVYYIHKKYVYEDSVTVTNSTEQFCDKRLLMETIY